MVTSEQMKHVMAALPILGEADDSLLNEFRQKASLVHIPKGHDVFLEGDSVDAIALLLSGVVRVYKISESGREITLYRFGNGESCILTANAILSRNNFPAVATVEREAEAVLIPAESFRAWVDNFTIWRDFVFDLLSLRLSVVMEIVEEVAFQRMDTRLAALLLKQSDSSGLLQTTHQEIASELGSSREVISRLLEDFATKGIINSNRGSIEILDQQALIDFSNF